MKFLLLFIIVIQFRAELCRMDDVMENTKISAAEDIRRRLIDFTSARVSMINVYNSFLVESSAFSNLLFHFLITNTRSNLVSHS